MIVQRLPRSMPGNNRHLTPVYDDHMLFTERIDRSYTCPEHISGTGILSMLVGNGTCLVNGRKEMLEPGTFFVINHGSRLSVHLPNTATQPFFLFFKSQMAAHADLSFLERAHPKPAGFRRHFDWLAGLGNNCSSFSALKADSMVFDILRELGGQNCSARCISEKLPNVKQTTRIELFKRLSQTREWIEAHCASPMTLQDMAKVAGLNRQHFLRMFRRCYQFTPHQFLTEVRLEKAKTMLSASDERIGVICHHIGFEGFSTFSRLFRLRFGVSPSSFRRADPRPLRP